MVLIFWISRLWFVKNRLSHARLMSPRSLTRLIRLGQPTYFFLSPINVLYTSLFIFYRRQRFYLINFEFLFYKNDMWSWLTLTAFFTTARSRAIWYRLLMLYFSCRCIFETSSDKFRVRVYVWVIIVSSDWVCVSSRMSQLFNKGSKTFVVKLCLLREKILLKILEFKKSFCSCRIPHLPRSKN